MIFTSVSGSDWTGIYLDGKLLCEGHSLSATDLLDSLGHVIIYKELKDDDELDDFGNFLPMDLEQLNGRI